MKEDPLSLRIAHLSDPHFSQITYNPFQFFSKRWVGNLNLLCFRRHAYQTDHLDHLPELLERLEVESVCLTGDFSSTSLDEEFIQAKGFVEKFPMPVHVLPGNHDCYTGGAQRKRRFYAYLGSEELKAKRVEKVSMGKGWWYVGLDCALATLPLFAYGRFFEEMEEPLVEALEGIPHGDRVIVANHFPLFPFKMKRPSHDLSQSQKLRKILHRYSQVKLYLHGHDHSHYIIDKRGEGYPLILNSGSCAHKPDGTFLLIDLGERECLVQRLLFRKENEEFSWVIDWEKPFTYDR